MKEFSQKPIAYNSKWPQMFAEKAAKLHTVFGNDLISLHHIGSTAIPGLMAKPIIDMIGEVKDIPKIVSYENQLNKMGYIFKAEYGIPDRAYFSRTEEVAVHLHLFPQGHFQIEKHILFRDYLLAHPDAVNDYAQCKQELLMKFPDSRENYQKGKNNFILNLTEKAYAWAGKQLPASFFPNSVQFKPIEIPKTRELCIEFRRDSFVASFGTDEKTWPQSFDPLRYLEWLEAKLKKDPLSAVHLWLKDKIIGQIELGCLKDDPTVGYVNLYYLAPAYRGKGYSAALDNYATQYLKKKGHTKACLTVSPTNLRALAFYKKNGWIVLGPREGLPGVLMMEKSLK